MTRKKIKTLTILISMLLLGACAKKGGIQTGVSNSLTPGSAAGATSVNANKSLVRCPVPLGTLAVNDGRYQGTKAVKTVEPLIRLVVQQSNCFKITAVGNAATTRILNEITDAQRSSGEYRPGSKQHAGQRVAADYLLDPQVIVDNETTGGEKSNLGAGAAGLLGSVIGVPSLGTAVGMLSNAVETKTSEVALTLTDIRSTVQVAMGEGSAETTNLSNSLGGWGGLLSAGGVGGLAGNLSSFTKTPEGQSTAAAFFDAYNNLVQALQNYKPQDVQNGSGQGGMLDTGK
ncbi:MAG: hypothetical protein ACKN9T_00070 [Candidatus Methylumidiphilus sp.]